MSARVYGGLAIAATLLALGAWGGYKTGVSDGSRMVAEAREDARRAELANTHAALVRLQEAQARGDALTNKLAAVRRTAKATQEKLDAAIHRETTGRVCLSGPALRVLDNAHGLRVDLPAAASSTTATDGPVATDTDVGLWIGRAGQQYDECRHRLAALIDFHRQGNTR